MNQLTLTETFPHPKEKVFAAFATADAIAQWIAPSDDMLTHVDTLDFTPEGRFRIGFDADADTYHVSGQFLTIRAHDAMSFTWVWAPPAPHSNVDSHVSVTLTKTDAGTELTLQHSRLDAEGMVERHNAGWVGSMIRLQNLLKERTS